MWDGYLADRERVAWANLDVVFSDQAAEGFVLLSPSRSRRAC